MTTTRITLTVDVLDHGCDFTAGMVVGLLRGSGLTITGYVIDDETTISSLPPADAPAVATAPEPDDAPPAAGPGSQNGRPGRPPVYSDEDKARALAVYREDGLAAAVRAGSWSKATIQRWARESLEDDGVDDDPNERRIDERLARIRHSEPEPEAAPAVEPEPEPVDYFDERRARRQPPERRNFGTQPAPAGARPAFPTVGPIEKRPFDPDAVRYASAENVYHEGGVG